MMESGPPAVSILREKGVTSRRMSPSLLRGVTGKKRVVRLARRKQCGDDEQHGGLRNLYDS